jgi:hypothetical protein
MGGGTFWNRKAVKRIFACNAFETPQQTNIQKAHRNPRRQHNQSRLVLHGAKHTCPSNSFGELSLLLNQRINDTVPCYMRELAGCRQNEMKTLLWMPHDIRETRNLSGSICRSNNLVLQVPVPNLAYTTSPQKSQTSDNSPKSIVVLQGWSTYGAMMQAFHITGISGICLDPDRQDAGVAIPDHLFDPIPPPAGFFGRTACFVCVSKDKFSLPKPILLKKDNIMPTLALSSMSNAMAKSLGTCDKPSRRLPRQWVFQP